MSKAPQTKKSRADLVFLFTLPNSTSQPCSRPWAPGIGLTPSRLHSRMATFRFDRARPLTSSSAVAGGALPELAGCRPMHPHCPELEPRRLGRRKQCLRPLFDVAGAIVEVTANHARRMWRDQLRAGHTIPPIHSGRQASSRRPCCHKESAVACRLRNLAGRKLMEWRQR